ncbi:E3 ubiquitin protein ligase DRIP2 isoform X2 [Cornus florida]|uniref:E3 ubiquitin protein ligase DRIP2 isoform X2 n=1 Tax=Cornus florida TaxID=4283 RepID=UPI00289670F0|nr:E3 ubiquitin protein ligase DRIP2 isoform X2 [Cornus florida]
MSNLVVKVKRETIVACMTCPLCNKLFRDATTISECLHTFCRKCIYEKLSDEELECCPICNIDLGCVPLEKLRPDHNLQDVRAKIFPYKRRKVKAPEVASSVSLPVRRKERSLSSLVVSTPRVSTQTAMTGRRSKAVARKNSSTAEPSGHAGPEKEMESVAEPWEGKVDLWKPLNYLVEVANRSKSSKYNSQGPAAKSELLHAPESEEHVRKSKAKEHGHKSKVQAEKNITNPVSPDSVKPKKLRRIRRKRATAFGELGISLQAVVDAATGKQEKRIGPIWFSLVASEDQEGDVPLPQISAGYLRIKDGNVPVSFIQKYLMRKLNLTSEDEVEIRCMGQSVLPTLQLNNLVDLWLKTASTTEKIPATIGSSAKEFVMVLAYARKESLLGMPLHNAVA